MAGDWIKMRTDLFTHPKVVRISSALKADVLRTIGGLMSVWCLFDAHSVDGRLEGYTPDMVNVLLRWDGFAQAMMRVGWMFIDGEETLVLPEFTIHNGESAKRRAMDKDRKKLVRNLSASKADTCPQNVRPREEKRREELKSKTSPIPLQPSDTNLNGHDLLGNETEKTDLPEKSNPVILAVLGAFHARLPLCQRVSVISPKRSKRILTADKLARSVCRQQRWAYDTAQFWDAYFAQCAKDPWLAGARPNPNNPTWKQNIGTLLDDERFTKIMDEAIDDLRNGE